MNKNIPQYQCHKIVGGLKIKSFEYKDGQVFIHVFEEGQEPVSVTNAFINKFQPKPNGYLVFYADNYISYSPKEAFENGYSLVK